MKHLKNLFCLFLTAAICITNASAMGTYRRHQREIPKLEEGSKVSSWAWEEVERAMGLGICPSSIEYTDFTTPATRYICIYYASQLIAYQQNCDQPELIQVVLHCYGETEENGQRKHIFSDTGLSNEPDAMYYLGVANGRGDKTFCPDGNLTRQEAAAFLARTYQAYGGALSSTSATPSFTDWADVADWAKESVAAMSAAGIMQGYGDGRFAPNDFYTYEQCVVSLLRLCENMPISRKNGNIKPLFTYEQYMSMIEEADWLRKEWQAEGPLATFVKQIDPTPNSIPTVPTYYKFVYRSGAVREIEDLGICDNGWGELSYYIEPENPHFSEDGKIFYCNIAIPYDVGSPAPENDPIWDPFSKAHSHEAGIYEISIDIEALGVDAVKISDIT